MQNKVRNTIEKGDRKWLIVTVEMARSERWEVASTGSAAAEDPELMDTSHHVGCYLSGKFNVKYPGIKKVKMEGPCGGSGEHVTGTQTRYPHGTFNVHCVSGGKLLFVLPRGRETSLGYNMLVPGETDTIYKPGWAINGVTFEVTEVASGPIAAPANAPLLVFWEN